MKDKNL